MPTRVGAMEKTDLTKAFERLTEAMTAFGEALEAAERERVEARDADPEGLFRGALVQASDDPWYYTDGMREHMSALGGLTGEILDGPDSDGDWRVEFGEDGGAYWLNGSCLTML